MGNKIKNSRILVTGGAGLIGSHIVDALLEKEPAEIVVFDNFVRGKKENIKLALGSGKIKIVEGDIKDLSQIKKAMQGIDYVFHQAALWLLECEENPREAINVNIMGTFNVCEAAVENKIKKIIAASSSSVYGDGTYFPTDENHPFNNTLFYGATKIAEEQILRAFWKKYGLDYVAFRYLNVYGPRMDFRSAYIMVIMNFLNKIDKNEPPVIFGDGSATLDLVYVTDVARANILALENDITNDFFNVSGGKETSLKELLEMILKITGSNLKPIYEPRDEKLVKRRFGYSEKAKKILGFEPKVSIEEGLKKIIDWRKEELENNI
ncbi:MAG: SDR family NAD(P)-dependent oxidoreductase [Candidatus Pacebacteria bacterium]|nr:SDR family NAD(P)-dependent oxidoreductase [Candidatus Paceibacterota bacterium]MDD4201268.1 SDR family NAD(P)-dependent oxidoreductase [Candidatus Paceibacterota bacterium]